MRRITRAALAVVALPLAACLIAPAGGAAADPDTTPPTAPSNLRMADLSFTEATVAWDPSIDDSGWVTYETTLTAPGERQDWGTNDPARRFTLLHQGVTYTVTVSALDGAHNRSESATIQFTTPVDTTTPTAPTNLRFEARPGHPAGVVAWDASIDDSEITYLLFKETASGPVRIARTRQLFASVQAMEDQFHIIPGQTYTLFVQAEDVGPNLSPPSAPFTHTF